MSIYMLLYVIIPVVDLLIHSLPLSAYPDSRSTKLPKHRKGKTMATTFTNQATLSYNGSTVQSNIAVGAIEGVLSVTKNALTEQYTVGDTITYVVSIINNSDASVTGLTVTDDLGAYIFNTGSVQPLTYVDGTVQYYLDGVLQTDPAVATTSGLVISGITVPANGSTMIVYSAMVNEYAPLDTDSAVMNTVTVTGTGVCDVTDAETIYAVNTALLSIVKSVTPVPVAENGELTYTFQLQNTGNTAVEDTDNAVISDTFDPILKNITVTLDGTALTAGTDYTYNETTGVFETLPGALTIPAATFTQDAVTGVCSVTPGSSTLIISGTVGTICDMTTT